MLKVRRLRGHGCYSPKELGGPQRELGTLSRESIGRISEALGIFLRMLGRTQRQLGAFCGMRLKWTDLVIIGTNFRVKGACLELKRPT